MASFASMSDEELTKLFKKIDKNKTNTITIDELEKFILKMTNKSKEEAKKAARVSIGCILYACM